MPRVTSLLTAFLCVLAVPATAAVFGADDRVAVPREQSALKDKIGALYSSKARTMCTAFCVADDVVATAAHCLFRTAGDPLPSIEDFRFSRAKEDAKGQARISGFSTRSALQNVVSGSLSLSIHPPIDATRDWALARLATPVCRGHVLSLQVLPEADLTRAAAARRLFLAGYHRDFANWRIAVSRDCEIKRMNEGSDGHGYRRDFVDPENLILHTCDTGGASSGSPLLIETASGPVVVGINVGTYVQSRVMMQNGEVIHRFKANEIANTAVSIAAAAEMLPRFQKSEVLSSGPRLRELQRLLKLRSVYGGPVDGVHGPRLRLAIEAHERGSRMPVTGLPTQSLLRQLGSDLTRPGWSGDHDPQTAVSNGEQAAQEGSRPSAPGNRRPP